jgi:hypothetical protein
MPSTGSGPLKASLPPKAVNTTTGLQLSEYAPIAFGSLEPGSQATCARAYVAICCHHFKPENQTEDIFLAQILA